MSEIERVRTYGTFKTGVFPFPGVNPWDTRWVAATLLFKGYFGGAAKSKQLFEFLKRYKGLGKGSTDTQKKKIK